MDAQRAVDGGAPGARSGRHQAVEEGGPTGANEKEGLYARRVKGHAGPSAGWLVRVTIP